jgi:predicted permease
MSLLSRILNLVRRDRINADLDEEMQFHLASLTDEFIREGLTAQQAEAKARQSLGHTLLHRESSREVKLFPWLESIVQDVQFGLRQLRKNATVTAAAVLSLSLAIGACTAAFSLIDALILRPLPVPEPQRLVYAAQREPGAKRDSEYFNYPQFERLREAGRKQIRLFGMSYLMRYEAAFEDAGGQRERIYPQWISGDAFEVLGVKPALGRLFTAADDATPGGHPVAVISHEFWTRCFRADRQALGHWFTLRDKQFQIIGVTQKGFTGVEPGLMTDVWVPNMMWNADALTSYSSWFRIWGRLEPGVSSGAVREMLQTVSTTFRREKNSRWPDVSLHLRPAANGPSRVRQSFEQPLWVLGAIALLVLLIACSNVASLLVARTAARDREMALRVSIGAGRGRLVQQVLIESSLIALAACIVGALIAVTAAPRVVSMLSESNKTIRLDLHYDWRVLAFLAAAGSLVTVLFGLVPALRASSVSPNDALKTGGAKQTASVGFFRPLVAAQTAIGFVVLFVAGLFLASFGNLVRSDLGFEPKKLTIVTVEAKGLTRTTAPAVWRQIVERLNARPGVESSGISGFALFEGPETAVMVRLPGRNPEGVALLEVSPGFLETMSIRLIEGRTFEWRDAEGEMSSAAIVNESFARRYFPGESAVGKNLALVLGRREVPQVIVGVVRDARYKSIRSPAPPTLYMPSLPANGVAIQLRTSLDPAALNALVRDEIERPHPGLHVADITPQSAFIDNVLVQERVLAVLSSFFSIVAIILVAVGVFGVLSYSVVQRTREIGIRIALGSTALAIVRRVLSEAGIVTVIGLAIGVPVGIAASRLIASLLYDVKPYDPVALAIPLLCLLLVGGLAALFPAVRASRVNPTTALRFE